MFSPIPSQPTPNHWTNERRRLRWRRWLWYLGSVFALACWEAFSLQITGSAHSFLIHLLVHVVGVGVLGLGIMLLLSHRVDQRIVAFEALEHARRTAEDQAADLAVIRDMARQLTHQLNQPLTVALGIIQLLELSSLDDQQQDDVSQVRASLEDLAGLAQRFQNLSADDVLTLARVAAARQKLYQ